MRLPIARLAFVLTGSSSFADEIVQEAFLKVHVNWAHIDNPGGYLRTAVVNGCRSYHRHQAVVDRTYLSPPVHATLVHRELDEALAKLPYRRRAALALRYFCDLPDADIALALDVRPRHRSLPHPPRPRRPTQGDHAVIHLEDSLRDYYATKADELSLPARVFDGDLRDDESVSYISMGPEPRRRAPMLLAAAGSIALIAGAGIVVSRRNDTARNSAVVSNATVTTAVACSVSASASVTGLAETECSKISTPPLGRHIFRLASRFRKSMRASETTETADGTICGTQERRPVASWARSES